MGLFSWLFSSNKKSIPTDKPVVTFCSTTVASKNNVDLQIAELHKEATVWKDEKEWDKAIDCLQKARSLLDSSNMSYPIKHHLRLPLFLQQGGRFSEALQEFENLLQTEEIQTARAFAHQPKSVQQMLSHANYAAIYDSMRLACKRQGMTEEAALYEQKSREHKEKHAALMKKKHPKPKSYKQVT